VNPELIELQYTEDPLAPGRLYHVQLREPATGEPSTTPRNAGGPRWASEPERDGTRSYP